MPPSPFGFFSGFLSGFLVGDSLGASDVGDSGLSEPVGELLSLAASGSSSTAGRQHRKRQSEGGARQGAATM